MLDNKVVEMAPGEALLEAPIGELIQRIATSTIRIHRIVPICSTLSWLSQLTK